MPWIQHQNKILKFLFVILHFLLRNKQKIPHEQQQQQHAKYIDIYIDAHILFTFVFYIFSTWNIEVEDKQGKQKKKSENTWSWIKLQMGK